MDKGVIEEGKDKIMKNGITEIEYYLFLDTIYKLFVNGRRLAHGILIWYVDKKDDKEKENV